MRYWVVDCETTGFGNEDKVVEVGGFYCEDDRIIKHYESLVNPGRDIPAEVSAIHHITAKHVVDAPTIEDAMMPFFDEDFDFVVAHKADFDKKFMDFGECPWACTLKLSKVVYPNAPSHKNQVLRYHLGLPDPIYASASFAHRALYDAEVTTHLFHHLLSKATSEEPMEKMLHVSNNPILLKTCKLKKHADKPWSEVPRDYLNWILNPRTPHPQPFDEDIIFTARYYYDRT